jgi:EAL domain-containing protein (putative c-di-GMP-specific phosphodiesterase class I)
MEMPGAMFHAASQLDLEVELSRMCRWNGIEASFSFPERPWLFLNTHPRELAGDALFESVRSMRKLSSKQKLTLEVHEAAVTEHAAMRDLRALLDDLDISLAYDDFGAGQARLVELVDVRPDFLKFDVKLVRGIDKESSGLRSMVASLVHMVREMGVLAVAEGVETEGEAIACRQVGFDMAQGYHFGFPRPA